MGLRRWHGWVGVIAVASVVALAGPAQGAGPPGKALAAASKELEEAKRLGADADRLQKEGKYDEGVALEQRALAIKEKALGPDHPSVAATLSDLAGLFSDKGDFASAEALYQRAVRIQEKALGPDHLDLATSLNDMGLLLAGHGDYERAEALYLRALRIREKALRPDHPLLAYSLNNLGGLYRAKGSYARAEPLYLRALALWEKALGPDHPDVANPLNNLAELYDDTGDFERAKPLYERALRIREKALGPEHPLVAQSLNNLAEVYEDKGDYAPGVALHLRALAIREKALGPDHPDLAESLNNLAELYQVKGDFVRAEPLFQRALAINEKANHPNFAGSLNNLAKLYVAKGDFEHAEPLYQRAIHIREKALGPDHPDLAASLHNLATLVQSKGDFERAEALYQRAIGIREKALGPDHPDLATSLNSLASLCAARGDFGHAAPLYRRAIGIREKALGPDHPDLATSLDNLAMLYLDTGDQARAEPLLQRALSIREKALGPDHTAVAGSLNDLATLHLAQGRLPQAVDAARRAADIRDRNAAAVLATGSEDQKRLYMSTLIDDTRRDLSLHVEHAPLDPDAARLALTVLLRRKGRVLDAMTDSLAALRRSFEPADRELLDRLASVYARLAAQVSRGPERASSEHYRSALAALEQERQTLEVGVGQRSASFRAKQHLVTLAEVQAKIPTGAALVEIARYAPRPRGPGRHAPQGAPRYVAYVLTPSGNPTFADLGEAAPLEAAVDTLRSALGDPDHTHDPRPAARALDHLLMEPLRALLGATRWVFLSPDGPLNLVPFGALVDERGHYLVERYLFSYLTSGRDLLRLGEHPAQREAPLILANPAFDAASDAASDAAEGAASDAGSAPPAPEATRRDVRSIDMVTHALLPLESTAAEARIIAGLFPDSRVLLGGAATEAAVKAAHGPRLLHLATHGFFLPEQAVPAALLGNLDAEPTPAERAALLQRESPLLRSGIALAGFNKRRSGSDTGVLTALEAAGLDLHGTRLVVLSTCESGLGEASAGEGVYGMRRALAMAGAETQVMSLWKVDTGRTRELMGAYYQRLRDGAGRSEAMRAVQLAMLADATTASPNLWASFIVSGEWRPLDGGSRSPEVPPVEPGVRGCACGQAGGEPRGHAGWVAMAIGLALRRRRARR